MRTLPPGLAPDRALNGSASENRCGNLLGGLWRAQAPFAIMRPMKAMVLRKQAEIGARPLRLEDVKVPRPGPGRLRLRVTACLDSKEA
jgi:hypothetical protein